MQYILFCCYKKYYSNLRSALTVLNESLWGSEGWRTHLQSGKDQFHLSQFELPQQVPELADQRVIYDADMVTIQDHWPRRRHWRRDVRGESKWEENLKEERRLNKTDITTHYCLMQVSSKQRQTHLYPAEPESVWCGWDTLWQESWVHCRVPSPTHRDQTPAHNRNTLLAQKPPVTLAPLDTMILGCSTARWPFCSTQFSSSFLNSILTILLQRISVFHRGRRRWGKTLSCWVHVEESVRLLWKTLAGERGTLTLLRPIWLLSQMPCL